MPDSYQTPNSGEAATQPDQDTATRKRSEGVKNWHRKINARAAFQESVARKYKWSTYVDEFKGEWNIVDGAMEADIPPLNLVFAYIKTEIPSLYVRDPHIKVNPKNPQSIESAKIMELAINDIWRRKKLKREVKKAIWDGKLVSHAWVKTGYTGKFGLVEDDDKTPLETVVSEDYFAYRVPYDCVLFDSESIDPPYDCSWMAFKVYLPLAKVQNDPNYQHTEELKPVTRYNPTKQDTKKAKLDESYKADEAMACVYEIWDKDTKKVYLLGEGVETDFLNERDWPYRMKGFPVSFLCFNPVNDEPYGIPDVHMFERQILEKTKLRAMMLEHVKSFTRQFVAKKGFFDDEAKQAYQDGTPGQILEINGNPQTDIAALPYANLQMDIYPLEDRITDDFINISGQTPSERGGSEKTSTRTIREILEKKEGAANRRSEQIDVVEDFIEDIASNLGSLLQQYADVPYYVRVTGKLPEDVMAALESRPSAKEGNAVMGSNGFTVTKDDLRGEFDYDVVAGSTIPLDKTNTIGNIVAILEGADKMGILPGGPVQSTLLRLFAENQDMPELELAVKEEIQMNKELRAAQKEQQDLAQEAAIRNEAVEQQLEAEKIKVKENDSLMRFTAAMEKPEPKDTPSEKKDQ